MKQHDNEEVKATVTVAVVLTALIFIAAAILWPSLANATEDSLINEACYEVVEIMEDTRLASYEQHVAGNTATARLLTDVYRSLSVVFDAHCMTDDKGDEDET